MTDVVTPEVRRRMMAGIRGKDTRPELVIRRGLHKRGFRYRLHSKALPGKPDLFLPKYKAVILIHGCFWHGHGCHLFKWPSTRPEFWKTKISETVVRDQRQVETLKQQGWRVLIVWECALKGRLSRSEHSVVDEVADWIVSDSHDLTIAGKENDSRAP